MTNFELLETAGFKEFKSSQVPFPWWVNVGTRMAFSFAAVEDADFEWLAARTRETTEGQEFLFYIAYGEPMDNPYLSRILEQLELDGFQQMIQTIVSAK